MCQTWWGQWNGMRMYGCQWNILTDAYCFYSPLFLLALSALASFSRSRHSESLSSMLKCPLHLILPHQTICRSSFTTDMTLLFASCLVAPYWTSFYSVNSLSLLYTWPNDLNLASLTPSKHPICLVPLMYSCLILLVLIIPKENPNIFNSAKSSSNSCLLVSATISKPINFALPLINLSFYFCC